MFTLEDILQKAGIPPKTVAVLFHAPPEPRFRRALPWLVKSRREIFEAYQSYHSRIVESTLLRRDWMVSFVEIAPARHCFVGLYRRVGQSECSGREIYDDKHVRYLADSLGMGTGFKESPRMFMRFEFERDARLSSLEERLVVERPRGRNMARLAENLRLPVLALYEESVIAATPPDWRGMILSAAEVREIPETWAARLRAWRGIYLVLDEADGARYVGSAYGEENILGRWRAHVSGDVGVTRELKKRDTRNFRFSVLERVSPDMEPEEVIAREHGWMDRLHTRRYGLNA